MKGRKEKRKELLKKEKRKGRRKEEENRKWEDGRKERMSKGKK